MKEEQNEAVVNQRLEFNCLTFACLFLIMESLNGDELCFPQLNTSCKKPLLHHAKNILFDTLMSLICLMTVTLNMLVIFSISYFRQLHTTTNLFLLSLAVSDFLVGIVLMPLQILSQRCWYLGSFMCGCFHYTSYIVTSASVGNMVLISADRYVAICDPLHYPTKVTQRKVKVCVCLCWACSVLYNGVILKEFLKNPDQYNFCDGECVILLEYITQVFDMIFTFLSPITVIIVLYMRVFVVAVSQARAMRSHIAAVSQQGSVSVSVRKSERKAATAIGVVVVVFLICMFPYFVPTLAGNSMSFSPEFLVFVSWLFNCNSCLNPIIYAFFYPWFRKSVKLTVTLQILQPDCCDANIL
ncbi:trace amine-associated receptor 13c-like [Kryptolebias marmoratus]|uniref:trace amine-associated receptor 13c-like n=1 Tax=Kryptolebias marmoratus TaxID=37003 RepID=UPI0018ACDE31|nr:trace amine-associated receptor 13c-like [Kryptolebias marmoratus]